MTNYEDKFKTAIAVSLEAKKEDVFLYWKGRVALFAILKAMNIKNGDEVIVPAFTCVVVSNAIKYCGAVPVYVDINPVTYNADIKKIEENITSRTRAVVCQNTFGLSSDIEKIIELAEKHDLYTIEDCTHGFGGTYNGNPNGTFCDSAFFSTQWNKPFSTGIGGFAYVKNEKIRNQLHKLNTGLHKTTFKDNFSLYLLYFISDYLLTDALYWQMLKLYRWLSKYNLIQGSSSGAELISTEIPSAYFKEMSSAQIRKGCNSIGKLSGQLKLRKENAVKYTLFLKSKAKKYVDETLTDNHSFLKYPILVTDRKKVLHLAEKYKIPLGDWFCSPLHPVKENLERWNMNPELFPIACKISSQIVNLPADTKSIDRILVFLGKIETLII